MKIITLVLSVFLAVACTSTMPAIPALAADHPEARVFDAVTSIDAQAAVDEKLAEAALTGKHAIIVLGADWCHDSRALAGWFKTPRFEAMLQEGYVVQYIDVAQKNKNIDVAQRFGLENIVGTPTIFVTDSQGQILNFETAPSWRNAASRTEESIYAYFSELAPQ